MTENKLIEVISNQDWDNARKILSSEGGNEFTKQPDEQGRLPLHNVFNYRRAPSDFILELIKANKEAVKVCDNDKLLPLHHAIFWGASTAVIESLIRAYPLALDAPNSFGDTPRDLIKIGSMSAQSKVLISKSTNYWIHLVEMEARGESLRELVKSGQFLIKAKELAAKAVDRIDEVTTPSLPMIDEDDEEVKEVLEEEKEADRWNFNIKRDIGFDRFVGAVASALKDMETRLTREPQNKEASGLDDVEKRIAALEEAYRNVNAQLSKADAANEELIEHKKELLKRIEESETALEAAVREIASLKRMYERENQAAEADGKHGIEKMEIKLSYLEREIQNAVVQLEETKILSLEQAFNSKGLEKRFDESKVNLENVVQRISAQVKASDNQNTRIDFNEKQCMKLEATMKKFVSDQKDARFSGRLGNLEVVFQSAIDGLKKVKDSNDKIAQRTKCLEDNYGKSEATLTKTVREATVHRKAFDDQCSSLKQYEGRVNVLEMDLKQVTRDEEKVEETVNSIFRKLNEHENKLITSSADVSALKNDISNVQVTVDCNSRSYDEKLSITSKVISDTLKSTLDSELKLIKDKLARCEASGDAVEEVRNDIIAMEAEWSTRHELMEKEIASVSAKLFDGDDWEHA